jgi:hypothetical protein
VLIYRSDKDERSGRDVWGAILTQAEALGTHSDHDAAVAFVIALGEAESAIVDALFPRADAVHPVADALRRASILAGRMWLASERRDGAGIGRHAAALRRSLAAIPVDAIPEPVPISVSEGYAYYALHPEQYAEAARRFLQEQRPAAAVVIGIRNIGASLSGIVAATIEAADVHADACTVRPRGHPFDRSLTLDVRLADRLRGHPRGTAFLIVDEGPGLSGSSFASVARALTDIGVRADAVFLFPSWNADGSAFKSEAARTVWQRHRRYCVEAAATAHGAPFHWRPQLYASEADWPATQPQHERLKWLAPPDIVRFAGLGHYGTAKRRRADALAADGLGPGAVELRDGYLTLPFVDGRPCTRADATPALVEAVASHAAAVTRLFPSARRPDVDTLQHMIETNVREGLGDEWMISAALTGDERRALEDAPAAAIDGRMLAHEWLRTSVGFTKVDALDHHADHFFPGTQDAGWDLGSAALEFDLPEHARQTLVERYSQASGDRDVSRRLPFYERAYLAFRLGYATMARETLAGTAEARRFDLLVRSYRARLTRALRA